MTFKPQGFKSFKPIIHTKTSFMSGPFKIKIIKTETSSEPPEPPVLNFKKTP
ncbi:MAG: hypothetical protein JWM09_1469 [Francisellaceae bacterium]|nr:hypothetical protein [Francisellaceae bacterium]